MPRKSQAALIVVTPTSRPTRLTPPSSLSPDERKAFIDLVGSCEPNHFRQSDIVLLCRYVEAIVLAETAARHLRKDAVVNGKTSAWLVVQEKSVRAITALSMRLRLSPQARAPNNPGPRPKPVSHYEAMRLANEE
jgi:hypothetical protein